MEWNIELFNAPHEGLPFNSLWRTGKGKYQEAQIGSAATSKEEALKIWKKKASPEKIDPFLIYNNSENSYWLCWWEYSSESRYLLARNKTRENKTTKQTSSSETELNIISINDR